MARGLKFRIWEVEGLYYLCSENKGPDQLCGYREADLRLCFRICEKLVFSRRGSFQRIEEEKKQQQQQELERQREEEKRRLAEEERKRKETEKKKREEEIRRQKELERQQEILQVGSWGLPSEVGSKSD